ncbi:hypothetical protein [Runella sp. SP2]|uniref:hypothetical protein n=1 Tax=Runella sp. SP2 TaxID=2268026 RepID=UPI000F08D164|nr:hypothetical protein [Runella sp. SP2]AYQ31971.1 hypothetical protein DTQ70_07200 [Runella sp. SP2]
MINAYDANGRLIATYDDNGTLIKVNSDGTSRTATDTPKVPTTNTGGGKFWDGVNFNSVLKSAGELLKVLFPTGITTGATVQDYTPTYPYLPTNPTTGKNVQGIGWIILAVVALLFLFSGKNPFKRKS